MTGKLVVIEGLDRCGKTTQISLLTTYLTESNISFSQFRFPARNSPTGSLINLYLSSQSASLNDHVVHLLFSANRWEYLGQIQDALDKNAIVILDRYFYSGIAYSVAKGLDPEWCRWPDIGLPEADLVLFFDVDPVSAQHRPGFGEERFEKVEFQNKVRNAFLCLENPATWKRIDASLSIEQVFAQVQCAVDELLK